MHLIVGLGNIGREYEKTRHNFGFLLLDRIIDDHALKLQGKKFKSEVFSGEIDGKKIIALKPHTFISGVAVSEAKNFYKIENKNIVVLHDDIDLILGRIKLKNGGGHAGHNGLKSLDEAIGKNYMRLRLGVGRPENKNSEISDYVLKKFSKEELVLVEEINAKISKLFPKILTGKTDEFLNKINL